MNLIEGLDKTLGNNIRLGIMSVLLVNDSMDFNTLKSLLNLTDGNLSTHILALEKENYVEVKKEFVGKKPKTTYTATAIGKQAFDNHLIALENLLKNASSLKS